MLKSVSTSSCHPRHQLTCARLSHDGKVASKGSARVHWYSFFDQRRREGSWEWRVWSRSLIALAWTALEWQSRRRSVSADLFEK